MGFVSMFMLGFYYCPLVLLVLPAVLGFVVPPSSALSRRRPPPPSYYAPCSSSRYPQQQQQQQYSPTTAKDTTIATVSLSSVSSSPVLSSSSSSLSSSSSPVLSERFVCLFQDYHTVIREDGTGRPYLVALMEQLLEQTQSHSNHNHNRTPKPTAPSVLVVTTSKDIEQLVQQHSMKNNNSTTNMIDNTDTITTTAEDSRRKIQQNDKTKNTVEPQQPATTTTTTTDNNNNNTNTNTTMNYSTMMTPKLQEIQALLELETLPELIILDHWNPFQERDSTTNSTTAAATRVIWVWGTYSADHTRHLLRISGFEKFLQQQCARATTRARASATAVYIGEGPGGIVCAGWTMQDDDVDDDNATTTTLEAATAGRVVPAYPQCGLRLLGYGEEEEENTTEDEDNSNHDPDDTSRIHKKRNTSYKDDIRHLKEDQVFVWSQQIISSSSSSSSTEQTTATTKFIFTPSQKGTITNYASIAVPFPPVVVTSMTTKTNTPATAAVAVEIIEDEVEGVPCCGEPAIDPSRSIRTENIGITEDWW